MQNQPFSAYLDPNAQVPPPASITNQVGQPEQQGASGAKPQKVEKDFGTKDMMKLGLVLGALFAGKGGGGMGAGPNAGLAALGGISEGLQQRHENQKRDMLIKQKQATDATNAYYEHAPNMDEAERETARQHINTIRQQAGMVEIPQWTQSAEEAQKLAESQAQVAHLNAVTGQVGKVPPMSETDRASAFRDYQLASQGGGSAAIAAGESANKYLGIPIPEGTPGTPATHGSVVEQVWGAAPGSQQIGRIGLGYVPGTPAKSGVEGHIFPTEPNPTGSALAATIAAASREKIANLSASTRILLADKAMGLAFAKYLGSVGSTFAKQLETALQYSTSPDSPYVQYILDQIQTYSPQYISSFFQGLLPGQAAGQPPTATAVPQGRPAMEVSVTPTGAPTTSPGGPLPPAGFNPQSGAPLLGNRPSGLGIGLGGQTNAQRAAGARQEKTIGQGERRTVVAEKTETRLAKGKIANVESEAKSYRNGPPITYADPQWVRDGKKGRKPSQVARDLGFATWVPPKVFQPAIQKMVLDGLLESTPTGFKKPKLDLIDKATQMTGAGEGAGNAPQTYSQRVAAINKAQAKGRTKPQVTPAPKGKPSVSGVNYKAQVDAVARRGKVEADKISAARRAGATDQEICNRLNKPKAK